jgi:hypothetical protein
MTGGMKHDAHDVSEDTMEPTTAGRLSVVEPEQERELLGIWLGRYCKNKYGAIETSVSPTPRTDGRWTIQIRLPDGTLRTGTAWLDQDPPEPTRCGFPGVFPHLFLD